MVMEIDNEHVEQKKVLPWYVNGTLVGKERKRAERYIEGHEEARVDVAFLQSIQTVIQQEQDEVVSPGELGWRRLQKTINEERQKQSVRPVTQNRWWRPTLAAAALLLMIQGGVLLQIWPVHQQHYTVLSSRQQAATGAVLQVSFDPDVSEVRLREIINGIDATIIGGPGALGIYRLLLPIEISQVAEISRLIKQLRNTPGVAAVDAD